MIDERETAADKLRAMGAVLRYAYPVPKPTDEAPKLPDKEPSNDVG